MAGILKILEKEIASAKANFFEETKTAPCPGCKKPVTLQKRGEIMGEPIKQEGEDLGVKMVASYIGGCACPYKEVAYAQTVCVYRTGFVQYLRPDKLGLEKRRLAELAGKIIKIGSLIGGPSLD